jgi:hypothetical protein
VLVAIKDFEVVIDGVTERIRAGVSYVDEEHEVARRFPDRFRPERAGRREGFRSAHDEMTLEEHLRRRRDRLAELATRDYGHHGRPGRFVREGRFWDRAMDLAERTDADRETPQERAQDAAAYAAVDRYGRARVAAIEAELRDLGAIE